MTCAVTIDRKICWSSIAVYGWKSIFPSTMVLVFVALWMIQDCRNRNYLHLMIVCAIHFLYDGRVTFHSKLFICDVCDVSSYNFLPFSRVDFARNSVPASEMTRQSQHEFQIIDRNYDHYFSNWHDSRTSPNRSHTIALAPNQIVLTFICDRAAFDRSVRDDNAWNATILAGNIIHAALWRLSKRVIDDDDKQRAAHTKRNEQINRWCTFGSAYALVRLFLSFEPISRHLRIFSPIFVTKSRQWNVHRSHAAGAAVDRQDEERRSQSGVLRSVGICVLRFVLETDASRLTPPSTAAHRRERNNWIDRRNERKKKPKRNKRQCVFLRVTIDNNALILSKRRKYEMNEINRCHCCGVIWRHIRAQHAVWPPQMPAKRPTKFARKVKTIKSEF